MCIPNALTPFLANNVLLTHWGKVSYASAAISYTYLKSIGVACIWNCNTSFCKSSCVQQSQSVKLQVWSL